MKNGVLRVFCSAILVLSLVLLTQTFSEASETTIEKILSSKETYDGKEVSVSGKVSSVKQKTSKVGNPYTTFLLGGAQKGLAVDTGQDRNSWRNGDRSGKE